MGQALQWGGRALAFFAIFLMTSCGGGGTTGTTASGNVTPTPIAAGVLVDAPVCGVNYTTSSGFSGITDANGQFKFTPGDQITFTAAGIKLGSGTPVTSADGTAVLTPIDLVAGASGNTDARVTAIGVFLNSLNTVSIGTGAGSKGIFVVPTDANFLGALNRLGSVISDFSSTQLQSAIDTVFGTGKYFVTSNTDAVAALNQGLNSKGVIGTIWTGICTCGGGGTFYFQSNGTLIGFTDDGEALSGSWTGDANANGGVQISLISSGGGYTKNGIIRTGATSGSADIYSSTNVFNGTIAFTKVNSSVTLSNSLSLGGWFATLTPNAAAIAAGTKGGQAYLIAAPDGTFYGIIDGQLTRIKGSWTPVDGAGTATFTNTDGKFDIALNFSTQQGSVTKNGIALGTLSLSRTGNFIGRRANPAIATIPLLLNVRVSWANAPGNSVSSLALGVNVFDASGTQIASAVKSESTPLRTDSVRTTTTDNIAASYPAGTARSYSTSVGPSNCAISGGSGAVVDANSGNAAAYPTVSVVCN